MGGHIEAYVDTFMASEHSRRIPESIKGFGNASNGNERALHVKPGIAALIYSRNRPLLASQYVYALSYLPLTKE